MPSGQSWDDVCPAQRAAAISAASDNSQVDDGREEAVWTGLRVTGGGPLATVCQGRNARRTDLDGPTADQLRSSCSTEASAESRKSR